VTKLSLKKYLSPSVERAGFQTRVDVSLLAKVNELRKAEGLSWQDLVEALFRAYISETKKEKSNNVT
jgi:uncharacterized protein (DUF4415 family)